MTWTNLFDVPPLRAENGMYETAEIQRALRLVAQDSPALFRAEVSETTRAISLDALFLNAVKVIEENMPASLAERDVVLGHLRMARLFGAVGGPPDISGPDNAVRYINTALGIAVEATNRYYRLNPKPV